MKLNLVPSTIWKEMGFPNKVAGLKWVRQHQLRGCQIKNILDLRNKVREIKNQQMVEEQEVDNEITPQRPIHQVKGQFGYVHRYGFLSEFQKLTSTYFVVLRNGHSNYQVLKEDSSLLEFLKEITIESLDLFLKSLGTENSEHYYTSLFEPEEYDPLIFRVIPLQDIHVEMRIIIDDIEVVKGLENTLDKAKWKNVLYFLIWMLNSNQELAFTKFDVVISFFHITSTGSFANIFN